MRMKKVISWVVLADGARARVLRNDGPGTGLTIIGAHESTAARKPTRDIGADRPGRGQESANTARHALAPRVDWHEFEKTAFAKGLADYLNEAAGKKEFDALILAAPPKTLGEMRKALGAPVHAALTCEIGKDLTNIPLADLPDHLADHIRL